ncbi:3'(2'),5'-bisphosphate nucleotidase CysQ [Wenxinia marina]|uniref:Archaeal fructose-1,6-bisphosphatase n=1 Tax=Wenxinia marina DSM 24838 TaxID=1123501 RepID=A0A0D0Q7G6_9RHOB|nr:3'(2'),5'-bisphosphate nucleotidase CysQ [Wenxinia marina]KIQ70389.1 Archaeal fructose-1,6-bisphosphatase [Wenxinia marina DSM 24838]GGL53561.1 3'(2'),5'-bisphosphate nucleotidase CysQ [Wenxinia marina]
MPATDLDLLVEAATGAGEIALAIRARGYRTWHKGDEGPATDADLASDAHLRDRLIGARPDYGWLSEETEDGPERLSRERVFIVDPIDGTRAFMEGSRDWGVSVAVAEAGRIVAAAVAMPARGTLYAAAAGQGATRDGAPIRASGAADMAEAEVLCAKPTLAGQLWRGGAPPPFRRAFRSSLAFRLCLVAEGRYDAMLTLRPTWEWDVAAGALIVTEAGGSATDRAGLPLRFNGAVPRLPGIVAGGGVQAALVEALM